MSEYRKHIAERNEELLRDQRKAELGELVGRAIRALSCKNSKVTYEVTIVNSRAQR